MNGFSYVTSALAGAFHGLRGVSNKTEDVATIGTPAPHNTHPLWTPPSVMNTKPSATQQQQQKQRSAFTPGLYSAAAAGTSGGAAPRTPRTPSVERCGTPAACGAAWPRSQQPRPSAAAASASKTAPPATTPLPERKRPRPHPRDPIEAAEQPPRALQRRRVTQQPQQPSAASMQGRNCAGEEAPCLLLPRLRHQLFLSKARLHREVNRRQSAAAQAESFGKQLSEAKQVISEVRSQYEELLKAEREKWELERQHVQQQKQECEQQRQEALQELQRAQEKAKVLERDHAEATSKVQQTQATNMKLSRQLAQLMTDYQNLKERHAEYEDPPFEEKTFKTGPDSPPIFFTCPAQGQAPKVDPSAKFTFGTRAPEKPASTFTGTFHCRPDPEFDRAFNSGFFREYAAAFMSQQPGASWTQQPIPTSSMPVLNEATSVETLLRFLREAGAEGLVKPGMDRAKLLELALAKTNSWEIRRVLACQKMGDKLNGALEVFHNLCGEDLSRMYRKMALQLHPDKNGDDKELATKAFQYLGEAAAFLGCKK
ncbi:hypothetical protein VOLCADRAFT_93967 [Volvox carteri f. nagariensis]|uniref:J domain-containing protein n=1 Tax=Volvox carteri f. nagariensis TaxID=3068 RepID=D8U3J8_VOLCA|nr:uncharacterized protein VOLCADRAFT_93967 [Volvox carteri f. nagariensis]EFJ45770.1 hypothetical protein VOLCADRAFT_93967 [Volvox carteri f. nagariensis]|eukprot:XP_002953171.1 hypothetical protein VOLCADRAFT_93967 [Volvox carteri f. nagariensis]